MDKNDISIKFGIPSPYGTNNNREIFAECYTLLMPGDCVTKDIILKYFPETLNLVKNMLTDIHNKTREERNISVLFKDANKIKQERKWQNQLY